jgi:hypothetical protein
MKLRHVVSMVLAATVCATVVNDASAQEKTRAQVRQELIDAENHGLRLVTDTSYPDINPIYQQRAMQMNAEHASGSGPEMSGTSGEGRKTAPDMTKSKDACVGPVSFCNIYFGS